MLKRTLWPQGWTRLRTRVWQSKAQDNDVESEPINVIDVMKIEEGEERVKEEEEEEYRDGYR